MVAEVHPHRQEILLSYLMKPVLRAKANAPDRALTPAASP